MYRLFKLLKSRNGPGYDDRIRSGDFRRYAVYELFLVTLGLLMALQIDRIQEAKSERRQMYGTLRNLHQEMSDNLDIARRQISGKSAYMNAGALILDQCGKGRTWDGSLNFDSLLHFVIVSGYIHFPETGVTDELTSSGKIDLLVNEELRYLITSLPHSWKLIQSEDDRLRANLHDHFIPFVGKRYPVRQIAPHVQFGGLDYLIGASNFSSDPSLLLQDMEFESLLTTQHIWTNISIYFYQDLEELYSRIIDLIEESLEV